MDNFDAFFSAPDAAQPIADFTRQTLKTSTQALLRRHQHRLWSRRVVVALVAMSIGVGAFYLGRRSPAAPPTVVAAAPVTVTQGVEARRREVMSLFENKDSFWSRKLAQATVPAPYIRPPSSSAMSWWERLAQLKTPRDIGAQL